VLKADPEFADVYMLDTVMVVSDAHAAARRTVVVQPRDDLVTLLGRTTQLRDYNAADCLLSETDPACSFDKPGMLTVRHKHSVSRADFASEAKCDFKGHLSAPAEQALAEYWDRQLYGI
jgi:hypothetical protein